MKFSLFLGAGASVPFGFPDTKALKTSLEESLENSRDEPMLSVLQKSGYDDIGSVLTAINALVDLPSNPGYDLIKNTKIMHEHTQDAPRLDKSFDELINDFSVYRNKIKSYFHEKYSWKNSLPKALKLYNGIFSILKKSDDGIHICTTNYDQVIEHYVDDSNELIRIDGFNFDDVERKFFFQRDMPFNDQQINISNIVPCNLYKLHGSINWIPYEAKIRQCEVTENLNVDRIMIYPGCSSTHSGYQREPYVTMLKKFKERIEKTDIFIVIGYSFRDVPINEMFKEFLHRGGTKMFVISPSAKDDTIRVLGNEFSYCNIDFRNELPEWICRYRELRDYLYDANSIDPRHGSFRERLGDYFEQSGMPNDAKVYNLIVTLEKINAVGALDIIHLISDIASEKL